MSYNAKYVILDEWNGVDCVPVIFPVFIGHKEMTNRLGFPPEKVLAAGFLEVNENGAVSVYGDSAELHKSSRGDPDIRSLSHMLLWS